LEIGEGGGAIALYSESNGRLLVEVRPEDAPALEEFFAGLPLAAIGTVGTDGRLVVELEGTRVIDVGVDQLVGAWKEQTV